jgi:hypothetical protein
MALNHDGWNEIFSELKIIERVNAAGYFDITADQIKQISKREPRLMAKMDFREHIPPVMGKESLAILAISNGLYRIGRFDPFIEIQATSAVTPVSFSFPENIITINPQKLAHESAALDAALVSGILSKVFGEDVVLTIRGRSRSPDFSFPLKGINFPVSGVQIEIDGGYEGATTVNLVEAKIGGRNNLSVRQLIYPQMAWEQTVGRQKTVKTFICFYQEPILRFIPVVYADGFCRADHQNELAFILEPEAKLSPHSIEAHPDKWVSLQEARVPFPQADKFETVLAMFSIVMGGDEISKEDLLLQFDIDPRQIDYYSNAMKWLGVVEIKNGVISPTETGKSIFSLSHAARIKRLAEIVFSEPLFHYVLKNPTENVPSEMFMRWHCESASTQYRRLQTVRSWIKYFESFSKQEAKS